MWVRSKTQCAAISRDLPGKVMKRIMLSHWRSESFIAPVKVRTSQNAGKGLQFWVSQDRGMPWAHEGRFCEARSRVHVGGVNHGRDAVAKTMP